MHLIGILYLILFTIHPILHLGTVVAHFEFMITAKRKASQRFGLKPRRQQNTGTIRNLRIYVSLERYKENNFMISKHNGIILIKEEIRWGQLIIDILMIVFSSRGRRSWPGKNQNLNSDFKDTTSHIMALSKQMIHCLKIIKCEE